VELWSVSAGGKSEKGGRLSWVCSLCCWKKRKFFLGGLFAVQFLSVGKVHVFFFLPRILFFSLGWKLNEFMKFMIARRFGVFLIPRLGVSCGPVALME